MKLGKVCKGSGRRRKICIAASAAAAAAVIVIVIVVVGFTVFRPRHAITIINAFSLGDVRGGNTTVGVGIDLNATLIIDLSVTNPNRARFSYPGGGTAELYYRDTLAGVAAIPPGAIGARDTVQMNVTVTLLAARLIPSSDRIYADVLSGSLPVKTFTRIAGKVTVLGIFKLRTVSYTTCNVIVRVESRSISSTDCKFKTKL